MTEFQARMKLSEEKSKVTESVMTLPFPGTQQGEVRARREDVMTVNQNFLVDRKSIYS